MQTHRIEIEPVTVGHRGQRYRVSFQGETLVESTTVPEYEGCRALVARGIGGSLEVWRKGALHPAVLIRDIANAALWTVSELDRGGLSLVRWKPFPDDAYAKASAAGEGGPAEGTPELADTSA